jgi:POT family proton-dependent oligopeptide transporter
MLNRYNKEPSTPLKFAFSFILMGIGFYVFFLGCEANAETGSISLLTFAAGYFFIICGELCISPIGLSMVTKLSPQNAVGMMMGIWFFASAAGDFFAGKIGAMMSVPAEFVDDPIRSLPFYSIILNQIGIGSIAVGIVLAAFVPVLRKWMGAIR